MRIDRDALGIPHVSAGSLLEVARGQGIAVAQDRAWQLEVERRRGEGTCAEVFGPAALEWDRLARRSLVTATARRSYAAMTGEARAFLDAFVDGVNETLPAADVPELAGLGLCPGRWEPWTPIAVFTVQHLLFGNVGNKLWRAHLAEVLAGAEADAVTALMGLFRIEGVPGGSNAVAVGAEHSASGLPMVAGDPHRVIEAPGCYLQVRLTCTDPADAFDARGLAFVGVPGVQHFGHTGDVAWGITHAVADTEDLYREELRRSGDVMQARGPAGWEEVATHTETIAVRRPDGSHDDEPVEIVVTDRGPVVLDAPGAPGAPDAPDALGAPGAPVEAGISLRTPRFVLGDQGLGGLPALLRARKATDVLSAFEGWVDPVDNLLVVDCSGVVEHRVIGRVPRRARSTESSTELSTDSSTRRTGHLPAGADGHGWQGWVGREGRADELPRRSGAATGGMLVSANDRSDATWGRIGTDFAPPHRRDRLQRLVADHLAVAGPLAPEDLAALLADTRLTSSDRLLDLVESVAGSAAAPGESLSASARNLTDRLADWDRSMHAASRTAGLFASVRAALVEAVLAALDQRLGLGAVDGGPYGEVFAPWFDLRGRIRGSLDALLAGGAQVGLDPESLVRDALESVAAATITTAPATFPAWGDAHVALPLTPHQQFGSPPPPGSPDPVPVGGDEDCVQATRALGGTGASVHGPVARYVWDLAGASRWVVPLGAHGDARSPHHHDQQHTWAGGGTLPVDPHPEEQP